MRPQIAAITERVELMASTACVFVTAVARRFFTHACVEMGVGKISLDGKRLQIGPVEGDPGASADDSIFPCTGGTFCTVSLAHARNPFLVTRTN